MTTDWKTVFVFISSTFNDMHAERDYLVKKVFPRLYDWCEQRRLRLVDVDLRWGVTELDATRHKSVVGTCLNGIDQCRPFFICFLGQRYGWIPKPDEIDASTLQLFPGLDAAIANQSSVTELEVTHAALHPFHPHDVGASVQHVDGAKAFFYLRDDKYLADIPDAPECRKRIYTDAVDPDLKSRKFLIDRQQNLRTVAIPATKRPFKTYCCEWANELRTPEVSMPPKCPALLDENIKRWREAWRQQAHIQLGASDVEVPHSSEDAARAFNESLTQGRLHRFMCADRTLGDEIFDDLTAAIESQYGNREIVEYHDDYQKELDQQEQFIYASSDGFVPRDGDFDELDAYVNGPSRQLFALTAAAGMGKSMLLANWVDRYRRSAEEDRQTTVHCRFVGASDGSDSVYTMLRSLLRELAEATGQSEEEIPVDPAEVHIAWQKVLQSAGRHGKRVVLIDALNQLDSGLDDMGWLPRQLPDGIKCIVSFRDDDEQGSHALRLFERDGNVHLSRVPPFSSDDDRRRLVNAYLHRYLKELDEHHTGLLIQSMGADNPLYFKVVLTELRVFGSFGNLEEKIAHDFGGTPQEAFDSVLRRLESDQVYSEVVAEDAVPLLFGLLANSRRGLSAEELNGLFEIALNDKRYSPEAVADAVQLYLRQVRPYLARRDGRYDFFYESFKLAACRRYICDGATGPPGARSEQQWHDLLASYFDRQPWRSAPADAQPQPPNDLPNSPGAANHRKADALPWHVLRTGDTEQIARLFLDLPFFEAKAEAGMVFGLLSDVRSALQALPREGEQHSMMQSICEAIGRHVNFIARHPTTLYQCLWNLCWWSDKCDDRYYSKSPRGGGQGRRRQSTRDARLLSNWCESWLEQVRDHHPWLKALRPPAVPVGSPQQLTLQTGAPIGHVEFSPGGLQIAACAENTVHVWLADTGRELMSIEHTDRVVDVAFSPCARRLATLTGDGIQIWNADTSEPVALIESTDSNWNRLRFVAGTTQLIAASSRGRVQIIDANCGKELTAFGDFQYGTLQQRIVIAPDGSRAAILSEFGDVQIFDTFTGERLNQFRVLRGGSDVDCATLSSGGDRIAVAAADEIHIWDASLGQPVCVCGGRDLVLENLKTSGLSSSQFAERVLEMSGQIPTSRKNPLKAYQLGKVRSIQFSPEGTRLVTASDDKLHTWDAVSGEKLTEFGGLEGGISCIAHSPIGGVAVGTHHGTIQLWKDDVALHYPPLLTEHSDSINHLGFAQSGRSVYSASDDGSVRLWDVATGEQTMTVDFAMRMTLMSTEKGVVRRVAVSPTERRLACVVEVVQTKRPKDWLGPVSTPFDQGGSEPLYIVDTETGDVRVLKTDGQESRKEHICFSGNGRFVAASQSNGWVVVWCVDEERVEQVIPAQQVSTVALSTDGQKLMVTTLDGKLRLFAVNSAMCLREHLVNDSVKHVTFSPDDARVAFATENHTIQVWDSDLSRKPAMIHGHGRIDEMMFSPDSRRIVTVGDTSRVLDVDSTNELEFIDGRADVAVLAKGPEVFRYRAVSDRNGTRIEETARQREVGWYPQSFTKLCTHPNGVIWTGMTGKSLHLFQLER